jgi:hypothetical protein
LRFTRTSSGRYHACGAGHSYIVQRNGKGWRLAIFRLDNLCGPIQVDVIDTKRDGVAVAREFELLGEHYTPSNYGGRNRFTVAVQRAYAT